MPNRSHGNELKRRWYLKHRRPLVNDTALPKDIFMRPESASQPMFVESEFKSSSSPKRANMQMPLHGSAQNAEAQRNNNARGSVRAKRAHQRERSERASASEASALARGPSLPFFHMRRTNTWHFLQQSGQFLRLSGRPPLRYGLGPTASKIVHFVEGNATCWSDAYEKKGCSPALTYSLRSH